MRWLGAIAGALALPCGCGLIVDLDRFREVSGDAPFESVAPVALPEGAGGGTDFGWGVPWMHFGGPFSADARIRVDDPGVLVSSPVRSTAGDRIAVLLWVEDRPGLAEGETATVTVTLEDRGGVETFPLRIEGLEALALEGEVDATRLRPRYARIETIGPVRFTGDAPVRLVAEGEVDVRHAVSVAAIDAEPGPAGLRPGIGGRAGREGAGSGGGCADGGSGAGGRRAGEGGAGRTEPGAPISGDPATVPLAALAGHGGGRGGDASGETPRAGGGGGGALWLEGATVILGAALDASGGDGEDGPRGGCSPGNRAGGGGGGAGGVVQLRARHALRGRGEVSVAGGDGGGSGPKAGGAGADGFARLDGAPQEDLQILGREGAVAVEVGPAWRLRAPIVDVGEMLDVRGPAAGTLRLTVDGVTAGEVTLDDEGDGALPAPEAPGRYRLCIASLAALTAYPEEAPTCVAIVALD